MTQVIRRWLLILEPHVPSQMSSCEICGEQSGTGKSISPRFFSLPLLLSFHHCSILIFQYPLRCVMAFTRQHIITVLVFKCGASSLTQNLAGQVESLKDEYFILQ